MSGAFCVTVMEVLANEVFRPLLTSARKLCVIDVEEIKNRQKGETRVFSMIEALCLSP